MATMKKQVSNAKKTKVETASAGAKVAGADKPVKPAKEKMTEEKPQRFASRRVWPD